MALSRIKISSILAHVADAIEASVSILDEDPMLLSPEDYEDYDQELWRSFPEERQQIADYLDPNDNVRLQFAMIPSTEVDDIEYWLEVKKKNEGEPREKNLQELMEQIEKDGEIHSPVLLDLRNDYPLEGRHRMAAALKLGMDLPAILIMQGPDEMKLAAAAIKLSKPKNDDPALEAFMNDFYAETVAHPFMRGQRIHDNNVVLEAYPREGKIYLSWIQALDPKMGAGTKAMSFLTKLADKHGVKMNLDVVPKGRHAMPKAKLVAFYKKFGFTGKSHDMTREPAQKPT